MRDPDPDKVLPTRFVGVGEEMMRYSRKMLCVRRPHGLIPSEACSGCWFRNHLRIGKVITNCSDIQCSSFDRPDGENVWFIEKYW